MPIGDLSNASATPKKVLDLIYKAFRTAHIIGAKEYVGNDEAQDAFDLLNGLIDQANLDKLFALYQTEVVFPLQPGKLAYTIGPSTVSPTPDVLSVRPVEILSGFTRRNSIDIPMTVTHQKEDYDRIQLKSMQMSGWEYVVYYQAAYPAGNLYFFMQPNDGLTEAHLNMSFQLTPFVTLQDEISLPPLYFTWLQYTLAERLCPDYGMVFPQGAQVILAKVQETLQANNIKAFPQAVTDVAGLSKRGGGYNVYADITGR